MANQHIKLCTMVAGVLRKREQTLKAFSSFLYRWALFEMNGKMKSKES